MITFIAKLRSILGTERSPMSMAPREVLFEAQRHFLEKLFDLQNRVQGRKADIEVPADGGPIAFRCRISLRNEPYETISRIVGADWGYFKVTNMRIREHEDGLEWLDVTFLVDVIGGAR